MKHMKSAAVTFTLLCALSVAGCKSSGPGQTDSGDLPAYSQNENQAGSENADTSNDSKEATENLDDLLETALLRGSVADFQEGSFQVIPDQDDGQMAKSVAEGMESAAKSTGVSYGEDCTFQIANINSSTGAVELESATASDVKKSTSVYVYGETQDNGEIHATKVLIPRFY